MRLAIVHPLDLAGWLDRLVNLLEGWAFRWTGTSSHEHGQGARADCRGVSKDKVLAPVCLATPEPGDFCCIPVSGGFGTAIEAGQFLAELLQGQPAYLRAYDHAEVYVGQPDEAGPHGYTCSAYPDNGSADGRTGKRPLPCPPAQVPGSIWSFGSHRADPGAAGCDHRLVCGAPGRGLLLAGLRGDCGARAAHPGAGPEDIHKRHCFDDLLAVHRLRLCGQPAFISLTISVGQAT